MGKYQYKLIDGEYQEIGEDEIDEIQSQQNTKQMTSDEFTSWVMPSKDQYTYIAGNSSYDVTNLIKSEFEKETQSLNDKYSGEFSLINQDFNTTKNNIDSQREKELQEQYINKEKQLDTLPSTLAQSGLDGGANQTENMKIETEYQGARGDIEGYFMQELNKLIQERDAQLQKEREEYEKMLASATKSYESDLESASSNSSKNNGYYAYTPNFNTNIKPSTESQNSQDQLDNIVNELYKLFK